MDSQQYNRFFDEDEASLLKEPPSHTMIDKMLDLSEADMAELSRVQANAVPMPSGRAKRIKSFIDRKLALGYHLDHVKKIAAKKFNISVYDIDGKHLE